VPSAHAIPILLGFLVLLLIGLVVVGFVRSQSQQVNGSPTGTRDDLLLELLVFAAFISGVFLTYVFLRSGF
jgi:nitrate reductase gamma subunit